MVRNENYPWRSDYVGPEYPNIPILKLNAKGKYEYSGEVIDAFEKEFSALKEKKSRDFTVIDPVHLFTASEHSGGDYIGFHRDYYRPVISLDDPAEPIAFIYQSSMYLHRGSDFSNIMSYYYPEDDSFKANSVKVGLEDTVYKASVFMSLPDELNIDWSLDGLVSTVSVDYGSPELSGFLCRGDLNPLYNGEAEKVADVISKPSGNKLEATIDHFGAIEVRRKGRDPSHGYRIRPITDEDYADLIDKMATEELLANPSTAPITEDLWKNLDILPAVGITLLPKEVSS